MSIMEIRPGSDISPFAIDPHLYPARESGLITAGMTPVQMQRVYDTPCEFRDFAKFKGDNWPIRGLTPLAMNGNEIQYLPSVGLSKAVRNHELPICLGYSGRACDISIETGYGTTEEYSIVNTAFAPGKIYMDLVNAHASQTNDVSPYNNMNYAYAIWQENSELPHPLDDGDDERYIGRHDFSLMDVMTGKDANPGGQYVDVRYGDQINIGMLSEFVRDVEPDIVKDVSGRDAVRGIDEAIRGWGKFYATLEATPSNTKHITLEKMIASTVGSHDPVAQKLGELYGALITEDLFAIRVGCRAAIAMAELKDLEDKSSLDKQGKQHLEAQRAAVRKEFTQPICVKAAADLIVARAGYLPDESIGEQALNPIRYCMEALDTFDTQLARMLGSRITAGIFANQAAALKRMYGKFPVSARILIQPEPSVTLLRNMSIKPGEKAYVAKGGMLIEDGQTMEATCANGTYPLELAESLYRDDAANRVDGLVALLEITGPQMKTKRKHLITDLRTMPGIVIRGLENAGVFGNAQQGLPDANTKVVKSTTKMGFFTEGVGNNLKAHSLAHMIGRNAAKASPLYALIKWDNDKRTGTYILGMQEGDSIDIVTNESGTDLRVHPTQLMTAQDAQTAQRRSMSTGRNSLAIDMRSPKKSVKKFLGKQASEKYEIVSEELKPTQHIIASFAIYGSTLHAAVGSDKARFPARVTVMRSEGRVSEKLLEQHYDSLVEK